MRFRTEYDLARRLDIVEVPRIGCSFVRSFEPLLPESACPQRTASLQKTAFLSHLYIKCVILPRQARDKHRENSKKDAVFPTAETYLFCNLSYVCPEPVLATRRGGLESTSVKQTFPHVDTLFKVGFACTQRLHDTVHNTCSGSTTKTISLS
jgi:hypothetical protein